jgi:hypothetical protein
VEKQTFCYPTTQPVGHSRRRKNLEDRRKVVGSRKKNKIALRDNGIKGETSARF